MASTEVEGFKSRFLRGPENSNLVCKVTQSNWFILVLGFVLVILLVSVSVGLVSRICLTLDEIICDADTITRALAVVRLLRSLFSF